VIKTTVHIFYCATVVYYEQNSISSHSLHEPNHTIHNNSEIEGELHEPNHTIHNNSEIEGEFVIILMIRIL